MYTCKVKQKVETDYDPVHHNQSYNKLSLPGNYHTFLYDIRSMLYTSLYSQLFVINITLAIQ